MSDDNDCDTAFQLCDQFLANGVNAATSVTNGYAQFRNNLWWGFVSGSGSGTVDNSIANLSRNTVASTYWTDTSLTNLIVDPMLISISRTNIGPNIGPTLDPSSLCQLFGHAQ